MPSKRRDSLLGVNAERGTDPVVGWVERRQDALLEHPAAIAFFEIKPAARGETHENAGQIGAQALPAVGHLIDVSAGVTAQVFGYPAAEKKTIRFQGAPAVGAEIEPPQPRLDGFQLRLRPLVRRQTFDQRLQRDMELGNADQLRDEGRLLLQSIREAKRQLDVLQRFVGPSERQLGRSAELEHRAEMFEGCQVWQQNGGGVFLVVGEIEAAEWALAGLAEFL